MFLKKKSNVIFRNYIFFGYITDNRNFRYKKITENNNHIGDKILSESGAVFFSALDNKSQHIDEIANKICEKFDDADLEVIKKDAKEFFHILEQDGFVVSSDSVEGCEEKDIKFSYKSFEVEIDQKFFQKAIHQDKSTQDFLEEYFQGKPQLSNLHIEITSKCNERCVHCYIPHENKICDIDTDLFYDIVKQCYKMNVLHITISGGEPFLHKNFCNFLKKCREYNFSVNVLSNLTLLDNNIIHEMRANPLLGVQTSLYAMDAEIHDGITQMAGSFEKTKKSILKLIENDIPLQISCPVIRQNKDHYADVIEWAKKYNVYAGEDYVIIGNYDNSSKNINCRLHLDAIKKIIHKKAEKDDNYIKNLLVDSENKKKSTPDDFICSVCNSSICIAETGDVYPCAGWQGYVVGNIRNKPLSEIWDNSPKVQFLRSLRRHDFPQCIQCEQKDFCTMCMVRNANESLQGDPLDVNVYFCEIAKIKKAIAFGKD